MRGQDIDYESARKTIRGVIEERRNFAIKHELVASFFSSFCVPGTNWRFPSALLSCICYGLTSSRSLNSEGIPRIT